jgi:hypothetical protein
MASGWVFCNAWWVKSGFRWVRGGFWWVCVWRNSVCFVGIRLVRVAKKYIFPEFAAGSSGCAGGIGGDVCVRQPHTPTVCMAGWGLIFGFDDSNGNKGQKSTIMQKV